jgi:Tfp pilus assembly protein PilX
MSARRPRGFVLIFVMLMLLLLTLMVASVYEQAQDLRASSMSTAFNDVSASNAEFGLQEGIRAVRAGELLVSGLSGTSCIGGDNYRVDCMPGTYLEPVLPAVTDGGLPIVDNGAVDPDGGKWSPLEGGGLRYNYVVFHSASVLNQPLNRYTVRATGYAGATLGSQSMVSTVLEAEIEVGSNGFVCHSYDCDGT